MSTYQPVPFNEGAPLDPSLLMRLQNNVTEAYTKAIAVNNATKSTEYTVKSDCNKVKVSGMAGSKHGSTKVNVPGFTSKAIVVATPAHSNTREKEQITIHISEIIDGQFTINAVSSVSERKEMFINWHISERVS
jgi:hypothetical protein